ncbi:MAG: hypothetical protein AB3N63_09625 [Puniceicoccaceae bacterium]
MEFEIKWKDRGYVAEFHGPCTMEEFINYHKNFSGDPRFDQLEFSIVDVTDADLSGIRMEEGVSLVALDYGASMITLPYQKFALIATDPHALKLSQYYKNEMERLETTWEIAIFPSQEDAMKWINQSHSAD